MRFGSKEGSPLQKLRSVKEQTRKLMNIGPLYDFLFCAMASSVLLSMPLLGAALFLGGYAATVFSRLYHPGLKSVLSPSQRRSGIILAAVIVILILLLITVYPIALENADFWRLSGLVLCIVLRPGLMRYSLERSAVKKRKTLAIIGYLALCQAVFLPLVLVLFLLSPLPRETVWSLLGGFAVSGWLECFSLQDMQRDLMSPTPESLKEEDALRRVNAYKVFEQGALVVAAALQVTQVITYAYIAATAQALILCMAIALLCTYAALFLARQCIKRPIKKNADLSGVIVLGLAVWVSGLVLFISSLDKPASAGGYFSLALCTFGATICVHGIERMEDDIRRVAAFGIGHQPAPAVGVIQRMKMEYAALLGQMIALIGLTLICMFTATDFPDNLNVICRSFTPLLALPALLLVLLALVFALMFPMTRQHFEKLEKYMALQSAGEENDPLRHQLEDVVVKRSLKHYGVRLIIHVMRPFYRHKVVGKENLHFDEDIPCIFVCNHGEVYGPIVTNLYLPYPFKPWVTYEMTDRRAVADRMCEGTLKDQKWMSPRLCHLLVDKILAPFMAWIMRSVESIPVYHDSPRRLMQTFRETTAAMQAGDNILIFPENAATSADGKYQREGVSEFFTGFTMIAQLYYNKTGKAPQFMPMYASKKRRTITFGVPTRYDPTLPPNDEKERLCEYLRGEMLRAAGLAEAASPAASA